MKSTNTFTTVSGMKFEANENLTYCWAYPQGLKGQRKRISKKEYLQAKAEDEIIRARMEREAIEAEAEKAVEEQDTKLELEDELLKAAEDPTVSIEEFVDMITTPKAKKTRKSKDVAYSGHGVTLTAKQVDFIRHLPDTNFWENGLDSTPWTDVLADEIGGQFAGKPMTTGAMISTVCEKGLAYRAKDRINHRTCTYMGLTDLGKLVAKELGLN